jgi:sec-independent protein translocase protein TatA
MNIIATISGMDMMWIFLAALLLFGAKKLPELAKGMGQAVREFNKAKDEIEKELTKPANEVTVQPAPNKQEYLPAASVAPAPQAPTVAEAKPAEDSAPHITTQPLL